MNTKRNTKKYIIIAIIVVLIAIAAFFIFSNGNGDVEHITVEKKTIVQNVLATGKTKAVDSVDLGFDKSGMVALALVDVGTRVKAGQTLIELDNSELKADLLEAQANLAEENAASVTDTIAVSDALANAKAVISDSYTKADNAVRENVDQFFENPGGGTDTSLKDSMEDGGVDINLSVSIEDHLSINNNRRSVAKEFKLWKARVTALSNEDVDAVLGESEIYLRSVQELVDEVGAVIFGIEATDSDGASIVAGYKNDISTARTTVNTALSNLISAREKLNTARAGEVPAPQSGSVSAQSARRLQLEAQIKNIEAQIGKTRIRAPFDGIVTKQEVESGEIVTAGESVVSVISDDRLEIESNISEVNIGKISVGNVVEVTFDAFQGEIFSGLVSYIDPGETLIDGVVNYKVKVTFDTVDPKIKSGLTTNLNIKTAEKADVVAVPLYTVTTKGDGTYVKKVSGDTVEEAPVTLGIVGQDGSVEVTSGLSLGDVVEIKK